MSSLSRVLLALVELAVFVVLLFVGLGHVATDNAWPWFQAAQRDTQAVLRELLDTTQMQGLERRAAVIENRRASPKSTQMTAMATPQSAAAPDNWAAVEEEVAAAARKPVAPPTPLARRP